VTFTHALTSTYKQKFRSVTTTLQTVPPTGSFTVTINGRPYAIDTSFEAYRRDSFHHQSIPAQRQSINYDNIAGAGTVNTEGLWRREQTDWSLGAGQEYLDRRQDALENRFSKSKGVDPWTTWQLSLLNDVKQTNATYTKAISVGKYVYMMNGTTVAFTTNWNNTPQTVSGVTGTINDICSNGTYVYVASSDGIWQIKSNVGTPTATLYVANGAMDHYEKVLDGFDGNSGTDMIHQVNGFPGIYPGMLVRGTGIPSNTRVAALASNGNSITLSNTLTSNVNSASHLTFTVRKAATITNFYGVDYANNTLIAFASTSAGDNGYLFAWPTAPAVSYTHLTLPTKRIV